MGIRVQRADRLATSNARNARRARRPTSPALGSGPRVPRRPRPRRVDRTCRAGVASAGPLDRLRSPPHQCGEVAGEPGPVGPGGFDPDPFDRAEPEHPRRQRRCPSAVVGNDSTPSRPPFMSMTAATMKSRCVSTPPTTRRAESTMAIGHPFDWLRGRHARPVKETSDRAAVVAATRVALRNGACRTPESDQPDRTHHPPTGCQPATPILTGSYVSLSPDQRDPEWDSTQCWGGRSVRASPTPGRQPEESTAAHEAEKGDQCEWAQVPLPVCANRRSASSRYTART